MRIKRLSVRNFRKFLQPVTLADLSDGVCVIAGDNEEGKSTVVLAIRSAFHLKYNTQSTQHIQPYNSSAMPEVAVEFDLNGTTFHLRKVFGKKGSAELRSDAGVFMGSEAEEKLHELCNAGAERKDSSIWNVLWVEQGTTFGEIKLGDMGKRTLQAALERELGSIVGGDQGQLLLKSVNELYLKWYTNTGRDFKNSEHKLAEDALAEIESQLGEANSQFEALQTSLESLDATRAALKAYEDGRTIEVLEASLAELVAKKAEVAKHLQAFEQAQQVERAEQAQHAAAATAWKQRSQLAQEVEAATKRLQLLEKNIADVTAAHKSASEKLHELQQQRDALEAAYEKAVGECESAERVEQLRHLQAQIREFQDRIERAESAQKHCAEIKQEGAAIKVDRAGLEQARQAERALMQFEAQLQAVATRLELLPSGAKDATINGAPVARDSAILLTERSTIELPGWGELVITPGGGDLDKLKSNAAKARATYESALATLGAKTLDDAEALERKRAELGLEWKSWNSEVQKYAPAGVPALQDELSLLRAKFEELSAVVTHVESGGEQLSIFSLAESAERLKKFRLVRDAAKQELSGKRLAAEQCEATYRDSDRQMQSLSVQRTSIQDELTRLSDRLAAERSTLADDALFQAVKEAEMKLAVAVKRREELHAVLQALNAAAIDVEIAGVERKLVDARAELQRLREVQSRLEGSLQTLGKAGIAEEVGKLRGKHEQAQTQLSRAMRKARAIKLLHDTLCEAEKNSKQQLAAPLMKRLSPYMRELFAGSNFVFDDDNFGVVQLDRGTAEPFNSLSLGTREQISVLTRLAFAETLAESGAPAVVILDDALVYSDECRFEKMQELLKRAAERFQIIIMTCRERDYSTMGVPIIKLADCVGKDYVGSVQILQSVAAPT
jgi:DNA repair exonuclease SbcCD ATPase subunit